MFSNFRIGGTLPLLIMAVIASGCAFHRRAPGAYPPASVGAIGVQEPTYLPIRSIHVEAGQPVAPISRNTLGEQQAVVTAVVSGEGQEVIKQVTGYSPKTASLISVRVCSDADAEIYVSTTRVIRAIIAQEHYSIYSSETVDAVLAALQNKDVFAKASKLIGAGVVTTTLLQAILQTLRPFWVVIAQAAPGIAIAILGAVADPRDLMAFANKLLRDDKPIALGKRGSANECSTGKLIARAPEVRIATVPIQ